MTVCTAAIFTWIYDGEKQDVGPAIIAASDRMLTDEGLGIQYEGSRRKAGIVAKNHIILVSGPFVVHSELLQRLTAALEDKPTATTFEIATIYARLMREYTREQASHLYLEPLPAELRERFVSNQRSLDPALVADLANQMQGHELKGDPEAIIAGCDGKSAHLYRVSAAGLVTCHDDIGFVSIGNGGIHASGHFMLEGHNHGVWYFNALFSAFAAKKRSEVAPGVGPLTDMFLVTRDSRMKIPQSIIDTMEAIYAGHTKERKKMVDRDLQMIIEADKAARAQPQPGTNAQAAPEMPTASSSDEAASANPSPVPSGAQRAPDGSAS